MKFGRFFAGLMLLAACSVQAAEVETVALEASGQHGAGVLVREGGRCYAVTPWHVVSFGEEPRIPICGVNMHTVQIGGVGALRGHGRIIAAFPKYDLSVLLVEGPIAAQRCGRGGDWMRRDLSAKLLRNNEAVVEYDFDGMGEPVRFSARIVQATPVITAELLEIGASFEGLSGSVLHVDDRAVAMVQQVCKAGECDTPRQAVVAIRFDDVAQVLAGVFGPGGVAQGAMPACPAPPVGAPDDGLRAETVSWSAPLFEPPSTGVTGLTAPLSPPCFAPGGGERIMKVVVDLGAEQEIGQIAFDSSRLRSEAQLASDVQVSLSTDSAQTFRPLFNMRLLPNASNERSFKPQRARYVQFRFVARSGARCGSLGQVVIR